MSTAFNWKAVGDGPTWVPVLNAAEDKYAIPTDLLARVAYQESSFRPSVIDGSTQSAAGAVGIMQLLPRYFPDAGQSPAADIDIAGGYLASLYARFKDWQLALAAYNWGPGNVQNSIQYDGGKIANMPPETRNYVTQISGDIGLDGVLIPGELA